MKVSLTIKFGGHNAQLSADCPDVEECHETLIEWVGMERALQALARLDGFEEDIPLEGESDPNYQPVRALPAPTRYSIVCTKCGQGDTVKFKPRNLDTIVCSSCYNAGRVR